MKNKVGVYSITCSNLKKVYIGKSKNTPVRIRGFRKELIDGKVGGDIQVDFNNDNGFFNFKFELDCLESELVEKMNEVAKKYVDEKWTIYNPMINIGKEKIKTVVTEVPIYKEVKPEHKKVFDYFCDQLENNPNFIEQFRNFMFGNKQPIQQPTQIEHTRHKTFEEYVLDKRDCSDEEDYKKVFNAVNSDPYLTAKQKLHFLKA